ncbi:MAG: gamma-glutamyltransferase [Halobacteriovoraceae bacterium]|nr:gamma-glutamyltransferase [Halobacteriovoraceae bacterium]MCB9095219.1 gamma-glutamyltransferase [Halobacteriovoraceae bacterium]
MKKRTRVAIAADAPSTVAAGVRIAEQGGNAADIALCCAITATLTEVLMCSLGGSAFISIKKPGAEPVVYDGCDAMPTVSNEVKEGKKKSWKTVHLEYGDGININVGHGSVAVPGMLKAVEQAWRDHGSLSWKEIVAPAIELAKSGVPANGTMTQWLGVTRKDIFFDQMESRRSFFPDGENCIVRDEIYKLPHYDQTLQYIADEGSRALYEGELAKMFVKEMSENGGFVTMEDLKNYRTIIRKPLMIESQGYQLALNPPPAVGGAMVGSMIQLYDRDWSKDLPTDQSVLNIAKAQQVMFSLRKNETVEGWDEVKAQAILEKKWLTKYSEKLFSPHTMHISVVTEDGTMIAITMSAGYGSGISVTGTGIALNNTMGEPELSPKGYFTIPTGERLVSNMSPVVAWNKEGKCLAFGSPGASRITTTIFQGWVRFAYEKMKFEDIVPAPRLHLDNEGGEFIAQYEPGVDVSALEGKYKMRPFDDKNMYFGALNIAGKDSEGKMHAVSDSRRHGASFVES